MPSVLIILSGLVFGISGSLLIRWGNPPNAEKVQYLRPEILGLVLGSFIAAFAFEKFRTRGGSAPLVRFLLGALVLDLRVIEPFKPAL